MNDRLNEILEEIRELEKSVQEEIRRKEEEFQYKIRKGKVIFENGVVRFQKTFSRGLFRYLISARPLNVLTTPVVYAMVNHRPLCVPLSADLFPRVRHPQSQTARPFHT